MKSHSRYFRSSRPPDSRKPESEVDQELAHHIELTVQELMDAGMGPAEARREAEKRFGDLDRYRSQCTRYERRWRRVEGGRELLTSLRHDLRYALRKMAQSPGFTALAVLSMALGIGANTAIFSLANAVLIRDLPFRDAEELVDVYTDIPSFRNSPSSYLDYLDLRDGTRDVFSEIGAVGLTLGQTETHGRVVNLIGELVTGTYFSLLGIEASLGRTLLPEDDVSPGGHFVVMLGHAYWQSAYGGDLDVLGRTIRINGDSYEIIGVAPADFLGSVRGLRSDFFVPFQMINVIQGSDADQLADRELQVLFPKGRLRPGVGLEQVNVALAGIVDDLRRTHPDAWGERETFKVVPTESVLVNPSVDGIIVPAVFIGVAVVGLVLLVTCANLASFLLARAIDRRKEIAIRLALGARRGTLIRQFLTETVALSLMGGVVGLVVGQWIVNTIPTLELPLPFKIGLDLGLNGTVLGLTGGATVLAGVLLGLAPALQSTNPDLVPTLKDESSGGWGPRRIPLRGLLVVGQVAVSLVLLISASLFLRSLQARRGTDTGFGREPTAIVHFNARDHATHAEGGAVLQRIIEQVSTIPGVQAVGITDNIPLNPLRFWTLDVNVDGVDPPPGQLAHQIDQCNVGPGFFEAIGIPLLRGRNFHASDGPDDQPVAIINDVMADRFWPGEDPLGRVIRTEDGQDLVVVGVTRSVKVRSLGEAPRPFIYLPYSQNFSSYPFLLARTHGRAGDLLRQMVRVIRAENPGAVLVGTYTMEQHLGLRLLPDRLAALFTTVFAVLALVLATIGLYGIVSHTVAARSREVGIRMSLGADTRGIVALMVGGGMKLACVGIGLGLVCAFLFSIILHRFLFEVAVLDPPTFLGVPGLLLGVALLAAYVPARRASRVDPIWALRAE
jgi:predicted permease